MTSSWRSASSVKDQDPMCSATCLGVALVLKEDGQVAEPNLAERNSGRDDGCSVHNSGRSVRHTEFLSI